MSERIFYYFWFKWNPEQKKLNVEFSTDAKWFSFDVERVLYFRREEDGLRYTYVALMEDAATLEHVEEAQSYIKRCHEGGFYSAMSLEGDIHEVKRVAFRKGFTVVSSEEQKKNEAEVYRLEIEMFHLAKRLAQIEEEYHDSPEKQSALASTNDALLNLEGQIRELLSLTVREENPPRLTGG